ncbi:MAG: phosphohydrolase [Candidatus Aquicultor primus]|uniref:Phosphohydrolase n=1 Tax=Candidatus Aquicultor primus TaxID=1797195 RepID=A0A1F2US76_9ACTN|nr:MAG: phosphohydrolase [Candidatus Aquicultor primus]HCG98384.1 phosphohydrolase [Actinomycetota bacterium]
MPVTLAEIKDDSYVKAYITQADKHMEAIGFTEHGFRHAELVSNISMNVLRRLHFPDREAELAGMAGYLHDIGNAIGRSFHAVSAAMLAQSVLIRLGMSPEEMMVVMNAIGNHEEDYGMATSTISAAIILGDKTDVHRSRVRTPDPLTRDIHDRVNLAAQRSFLRVDNERKLIELEIDIDTTISQVMEYFEIFLSRMVICRRAAEFLGCEFGLVINGVKLL